MNYAPEGREGIAQLGHRGYVGGMWDEIGGLQLGFLISHGMQPHHKLLDIGCGSLRLGCKAIAYLDEDRYHGIDKEGQLIALGLHKELDDELRGKNPHLFATPDFEIPSYWGRFDFAIANSLFTHLTPESIDLCLRKLRGRVDVFYATYFETDPSHHNPDADHSHAVFAYPFKSLQAMGDVNGFNVIRLGAWGHPRGQLMAIFVPNA